LWSSRVQYMQRINLRSKIYCCRYWIKSLDPLYSIFPRMRPMLPKITPITPVSSYKEKNHWILPGSSSEKCRRARRKSFINLVMSEINVNVACCEKGRNVRTLHIFIEDITSMLKGGNRTFWPTEDFILGLSRLRNSGSETGYPKCCFWFHSWVHVCKHQDLIWNYAKAPPSLIFFTKFLSCVSCWIWGRQLLCCSSTSQHFIQP
jgi:hypothetical protein